jgi:hypothetical protein
MLAALTRTIVFGGCLPAILSSPLASANGFNTTRDTLREWIEVRNLISREANDWRVESAILEDTLTLLDRRLADNKKALEDMEASTSEADEERSALTAELDSLQVEAAVIEQALRVQEGALREILPRLPDPLLRTLAPLVRRIPEDPENTNLSLSERVQNIVGILSQTDRFNRSLTRTSEVRPMADGRNVEVRTLYWGLGGAFFVDTAGNFGGTGSPGPTGWTWTEIDGSASAIQTLFNVQEGTAEIQFVTLPSRISE